MKSCKTMILMVCWTCVVTDTANSATSDPPQRSGDFWYWKGGDGESDSHALFGGYAGKETKVIIPEAIDGLQVKGFFYETYYRNPAVTSVTLPAGLTKALSFTSKSSYRASPGAEIKVSWHQRQCLGNLNFPALLDIHVAAGNQSYKSVNGVLFSADGKTLIQYPTGRDGCYTLPDGVTAVADRAFSNCKGLLGIVFPESVISIGVFPFDNCKNLKFASFKGNAPPEFGKVMANTKPPEGLLDPQTVFSGAEPGFTIYFQKDATGFTTPEWQGYPTKEGDPPNLAKPAGALSWTSNDGKTIQAKFVKLDGEAVIVQMEDGNDYKIPFSRLSRDGIAQAKELGSTAKQE